MGKFGGETDNWMWPRHTCDFSMFRVYAGKDNEPAEYSEDNVPYVPKQSLRISLKGINEGDYTMIMGTTILLAGLVIVANVVVDILYKIIDPRIKLK